jgi:hypothetical protein
MKPETAKRLEAILEGRRKQEQATVERVSERQKAQAKNLADFGTKKEEVIKPAFQDIVDLYKTNGTTIRIVEEGERPDGKRGIQPPYIRLDMLKVYPSHPDQKPEFRLTFDKNNRNLSLFTSTGSQAGSAGNISVDAITAEWIQEAFLKYEGGSH